ncbi:5307_t:CDS:2 [Funneliformis mosseae]|uniref:5307_t:CDS:1 n=1 Tax=Funneliformis mosseae TaxID=27381 RepID=A0A9N9D7X1_FUNMO|nr:5307_t:CDS:2 [Funneliformis mosseae]
MTTLILTNIIYTKKSNVLHLEKSIKFGNDESFDEGGEIMEIEKSFVPFPPRPKEFSNKISGIVEGNRIRRNLYLIELGFELSNKGRYFQHRMGLLPA